jgi:hypothetical protein
MDIYTIWADKEGDISDVDWVNNMKSFFDHLVSEDKMHSYRITRCKMGFRSIPDMPEWMILMEFRDMGQMDSAFRRVAPLKGELEDKHRSFNQFVSGNIQHALFRDWPDDTSIPVFVTTAVCESHASVNPKRARSLVRLFAQ